MSYRYTTGASADLLRLIDLFEARAVGLGGDFDAEVAAAVGRIVFQPRAFGMVSRPPRGREVREVMINRFPVVVTYEVAPVAVVVLSITHGNARRRPWRQRLP